MNIKRIITCMMTESDNRTHDIYRYLSVLAVLIGLGLMIYAVGWKDKVFDMTEFGMGIGALFTGAGMALKLKPESDGDDRAGD